MKILYIITKASWGGAQKYVYELSTGAQAAGHEVVVASGGTGLLTERLEAVGVRAVVLVGLTRDVGILREVRVFLALVRLLRHERPDVVHVNSSKAGGLGTLAARLAGVGRIVFTAHGWAWNEQRPWWQKIVIYKLAWLTILLSHKTICVSEAICRDTRWMPFVHRKLIVIYNGVGEPVYKPHDEARRALWPGHEDGYWVGMLSELHPMKRVEDALEAFTLLRKEHPETRLIVLGEGEERARLEWLISARDLAGSVRLAGFVPDGASYLRAFDLFLHTSGSEALAYAIIEAGLAGLPVVATRVGGIPEVVEDGRTGLLVSARAPHEVVAALIKLIGNPKRACAMGNALQADVRERFNQERMVHETLALYKD